jgi:hypothetical protein
MLGSFDLPPSSALRLALPLSPSSPVLPPPRLLSFLLAPMESTPNHSTLEHSTPERLRQVLLRHDHPSWPYPTEEDARELIRLVEHIYRNRSDSAIRMDEAIAMWLEHLPPTWVAVGPQQWVHFRSAFERALLRLSEGESLSRIAEVSVSSLCRGANFHANPLSSLCSPGESTQ